MKKTEKRICERCGQEIKPRTGHYKDVTFVYWCDCDFEERMKLYIQQEEAEKKQRIKQYFANARIGRRYADCSLENFNSEGNEEAFNAIIKYVENLEQNIESGTGLVLCGSVGVGKTHLAVAVLKEAIKKGYSGLFQNAPGLMYRFNATYSTAETTEEALLTTLRDTKVLVIDDLGKGKWTEKVAERFYAIINARYNELNPTIITTNLIGSAFRKYVGDAVADRLYDCCLFVELKGESYRLARLRREGVAQ